MVPFPRRRGGGEANVAMSNQKDAQRKTLAAIGVLASVFGGLADGDLKLQRGQWRGLEAFTILAGERLVAAARMRRRHVDESEVMGRAMIAALHEQGVLGTGKARRNRPPTKGDLRDLERKRAMEHPEEVRQQRLRDQLSGLLQEMLTPEQWELLASRTMADKSFLEDEVAVAIAEYLNPEIR